MDGGGTRVVIGWQLVEACRTMFSVLYKYQVRCSYLPLKAENTNMDTNPRITSSPKRKEQKKDLSERLRASRYRCNDRAPHHDNRQHRFVEQHVVGLPCLQQATAISLKDLLRFPIPPD